MLRLVWSANSDFFGSIASLRPATLRKIHSGKLPVCPDCSVPIVPGRLRNQVYSGVGADALI